MKYSQFTQEPQFSYHQARQVGRYKKFLAHHDDGSKRKEIQGRLNKLYKQRARARAEYAKPAYGEGSLSPSAIDQQVISGVRTKFGNEIDASPERQRQIQGYYDQWKTELADISAKQAQQSQAIVDAANSNAQQSQQSEQSANAGVLKQMQDDAAKRGATVDPSLILQANQASAARANTAHTQTNQMAAQQQALSTWGAKQQLINSAQRQSSLDRERGYTARQRQDAADYARTLRQSLDEDSWNRALGVKTLDVKVAADAADNALEQQRLGIQQQNADTAATRAENAGSGSDGGDSDGLTPTQRRAKRVIYDNAKNFYNTYYKGYRGTAKSVANAMLHGTELADGTKIPPVTNDSFLAMAVATRMRYGGVTNAQRRRLKRDYGLVVRHSKGAERAARGKKKR